MIWFQGLILFQAILYSTRRWFSIKVLFKVKWSIFTFGDISFFCYFVFFYCYYIVDFIFQSLSRVTSSSLNRCIVLLLFSAVQNDIMMLPNLTAEVSPLHLPLTSSPFSEWSCVGQRILASPKLEPNLKEKILSLSDCLLSRQSWLN